MHYPVVIFVMINIIINIRPVIAEVLFAEVAVGLIPAVDNRTPFYLKQH